MNSAKRRKKLGQHFLTDFQIIDQIIDLINPKSDDIIVEIGPGNGELTTRLVTFVKQLHSIEIDINLVKRLQTNSRLKTDNFSLHHTDALDFDYSSAQRNNQKIRIVGNLPYSISTQLIIRLLDFVECCHDMCFMVQKEVADRLAAQRGSKNYGRLTVSVARKLQVESVFDVAPAAFAPPPKVWSSMIYMNPKKVSETDAIVVDAFSKLVRAAFGNRRKTLRNSLSNLVDESIFVESGIDSNQRAQNLSVENYLQLARSTVSHHSDAWRVR